MSKYGHKQINWFEEVVDKLGGEEGAEALLRGDLVVQPVVSNSNPILHPISDGSTSLFFSACDGSEIIAGARDVFESGIDSEFKRWDLINRPSKATGKTPAEAYRLLKSATLKEMFTSLSPFDLGVLCVTEHQIKTFCKEYQNWFWAEGCRTSFITGTFFLTKKNWKVPTTLDNLFVVHVGMYSVGLSVRAYRFGDDSVWDADDHRRLVVPKLVV